MNTLYVSARVVFHFDKHSTESVGVAGVIKLGSEFRNQTENSNILWSGTLQRLKADLKVTLTAVPFLHLLKPAPYVSERSHCNCFSPLIL